MERTSSSSSETDVEELFERIENAKSDQMEEIEKIEEFQEQMERIREIGTDDEVDCLHEKLEESRPQNQKGNPHMLVCPCPKCSPQV